MGQILDKILTLTPKEKTVIQWSHSPKWPAKDPEGTKTYISICQAKGINRFCVLAPGQGLDRDPWREFYRTLPKKGVAATKMGAAKPQDDNPPQSGDREARMGRGVDDMIERTGPDCGCEAEVQSHPARTVHEDEGNHPAKQRRPKESSPRNDQAA